MCVVLVPNIGLRTTISNTTQIYPQHFRNFMRVNWECAWCQCQILVLEPPYPTLLKYAHSTSETSCVCTGNVRSASANFWSQNHHIQHYTNTPTAIQKLHVYPLTICVVLVPNIGLRTTISNTTQIRPQHFRNFMRVHWECAWCQCQILVLEPPYPTLHKYTHSNSETSCVSTGNERGASAKYWSQNHHIQHYTNTPTAIKKLHVYPLSMCVLPVPNIGHRTTILNTTQIRLQQFRNFMSVHWECAWCSCQILVLEPPYPTLHKNTHSNSETSCVSTEHVRVASSKYWSQNHHIQHYKNMPTALYKLHVCPLGKCEVLMPIVGLRTTISNTTENTHSTSETSCVCTGNVHGASAKIRYQHQHIQHNTNTPTALQKLHVCPLRMCVVLVPDIGLGTTTSNTTQIHPQQFRNFMCIH